MSSIISDDELNSTPVESDVSSEECEPEEDGVPFYSENILRHRK